MSMDRGSEEGVVDTCVLMFVGVGMGVGIEGD